MSCKWKFTWTLFAMQVIAFFLFFTLSMSEDGTMEPASSFSYFFMIYGPTVMFASDSGWIVILIFIHLTMLVYSLILGWLLCKLLRLETS